MPIPATVRRRRWAWLIVVAVAIVFGRSVGFDFVTFDDEAHLVNNPHLHPFDGAGLAAIWARPYGSLYIPATYTAWGLLTHFAQIPAPAGQPGWVLNPDVFHLANVALHAANGVLVFLILRRLVDDNLAATIGALAFAIHPVQVEPVAWVSGFKDTFSGFWSLSAILLFVGAKGWRGYATATLAYLIALCAKPAAVVVPPIAWLLVWATGARPSRVAVGVLTAWVAMALPYVWATHRLQGNATFMTWNPPAVRPLVAADALAFYGRELVWPIGLAVDYGRTPTWVWNHVTWSVAVGISVFVLVMAALLWTTRRRGGRLVLAGVAVFLVGVGPVSGLVPFIYQQYSTVADRYLYLPLLGVGLIVAWSVRTGGRPARIIAGVVLFVWAVLSFVQTGVWQNTTTLFEHNLSVNPASAIAYVGLGTAAERAGDRVGAERAYSAAAQLDPAEPKYQDALYKLLRDQTGREADARAHFVLESVTAANRVVGMYPDAPMSHRLLAQVYQLQGRTGAAAAERLVAAQLKATGHSDPPMPGDHW